MKNRILSILVFAVIALLSVSACSKGETGAEKDKVYEFKLAHFFPSTHPAETRLVADWIKAIDEATEGRVKITSYEGGTLLSADATYSGVIDGIADIGLSCFSYARGRFPVLEIFELPGIVYNNSKVASLVAWEGVRQLNPPEIQDTKLLMVFATGPGDLFTKVPVRTLADLNNLEIRATGVSAETLKLLGANPIAMSQGDAYDSLQKNVVKGNLSPIEVLKGWNHAEVTSYLTFTPFLYNTLFYITMNKSKWESLPEDLQVLFEETTEEVYNEIAIDLWDRQNEETMDWLEKNHPMEMITLEEDEAALWISRVETMLDQYVEARNKENLDGEEILETVRQLADKYNKIYE